MSDYERFLALACARRSVRRFSDRGVSRENVLRVLEAARWAPSNHNRQPWRFIVLEDRNRIIRLAERVAAELTGRLESLPEVASGHAGELAQHATCFSGAAVLIVVAHKRPASFSRALLQGLAQPELVSGEPLSAAMAVQNLLLASHALGLGACVLTAPLLVGGLIASEVSLPAGHELTCLVALGYPDEIPVVPRRKRIEQIVTFTQDGAGRANP
jgi:nitroreductase